ncbi:MAG: AsmA family protein [Candidatus Margulisiibacteriota bacterium]|jgi:uncharacterized protein involved in outer membrane biogenesis
MKKTLKWMAIVLGVVFLFLVISVFALPFFLPLDKIKDFAAAKISETIHRDVKIESVSFDLFSGIRLKGLSVGNRPGFADQPFITAESIDLRYAFWPLFSRQIIVKELRLVKPMILVEKGRNGEFNFSDLTAAKPGKEPAKPTQAGKPPFELYVSSFSIDRGRISYFDHGAGTKSEVKDLKVRLAGFELALIKPIDFNASAIVAYNGKEIPLGLGAKIGFNLVKESINISELSLAVAGESINGAASLSAWKIAPHLDFTLASKGIEVDPLLLLFAGSAPATPKKALPGELTKTINQAAKSLPANVSAKGEIAIDNLVFQGFKVDKINAGIKLKNKVASLNLKEIRIYSGVLSGQARVNLNVPGLQYSVADLKLSGFNATPFINALAAGPLASLPDSKDLINKVYGQLDLGATLSGSGVEMPALLNNLTAQGSLSLKKGALKRLKIIDAIAEKLGTTALKQDLSLQSLTADFSFGKMTVGIKNFNLADNDLNIKFNGNINLAAQKFGEGTRLVLRASPTATKGLSREYNLLRDKDGWLEATFELRGDLKKPFPMPILLKPLETAVGKLKVKVDAKKVEIENKAKEEAAKAEAEAKAKAEEEKRRLEEEAKNSLKNLFNK